MRFNCVCDISVRLIILIFFKKVVVDKIHICTCDLLSSRLAVPKLQEQNLGEEQAAY